MDVELVTSGTEVFWASGCALCVLLVMFDFSKSLGSLPIIKALGQWGKLRESAASSTRTEATDESTNKVPALSVPKRWFTHFYVVGSIWVTWLVLVLADTVCSSEMGTGRLLPSLFTNGTAKKSAVHLRGASSCSFAIVAMFCQLLRRAYESAFVSVHSPKSTMHLAHYLVGYLFYFCTTFTAALPLLSALGSVKTNGRVTLHWEWEWMHLCWMLLYFFCAYHQHLSHKILASLRTKRKANASGYAIPRGGAFEYVSSPHYMFEILLYTALTMLQWQHNPRFIVVPIFTVCDLGFGAWKTHQWYKQKFPKYPPQRKALIPFLW